MNHTKQILALGILLASAYEASALNYDPSLPAPAPILDASWASDTIFASWADSGDSPYVYNLAGPALFTITDDFVPGDTYKVWDGATLILTTGFAGSHGYGGYGGAGYSWGSVLLGAGAHTLHVQGDGVGGIPAGFFTRLDSASVPDASTTASLLGLGFVALAGVRRFVKA